MKWEDTVIKPDELGLAIIKHPELPMGQAIPIEQAEISFKAGIKEALTMYAWWEDGIQYVGTTGTTLKEALGEWG